MESTNINNYYLVKIRQELESRCDRNPNYSMRSFARSIGIAPASLSCILNGKRRVPKKLLNIFVKELELTPQESKAFVESNNHVKATNNLFKPHLDSDELYFELEEQAHFNVISEWEHYAIMSLMELPNFESSYDWIAKRLGIKKSRAQICIDTLLTCKLIAIDNGQYRLCQTGTRTTRDIPSEAIRKARRKELAMAESVLIDVPVELRDFSASTFTIRKKDLKKIKDKIKNFKGELMAEAEANPGDEVYKLCVQLMPLTQIEQNNTED